ncbi:uncharacterized protein RCC_03107 [Ramularia collo-cygni]|uniref:Uncharacterized protein n=1 Tax=Ramularia collo-cygni TaxID=112498 RepID=A0A2D3VA18_9PEZI|nr:uncharacterized protein RCC_03107 [Ramularia collo-cygni]CZT17273.1 uncharacterized protein RCC_03107 [Ramularia collo-cygni]
MLRDEINHASPSGRSKSADSGEEGYDVRNKGKVSVEKTPTPKKAVGDDALEVLNASPASMFAPISTGHDSEASSPSSISRKRSLKRAGSNIASLRATFEQTEALAVPVRRFEKRPSQNSPDRVDSIPRSGCEQDEIARLERQLANEVEMRQSCQSQLKSSQERCEQLELEVRAGREQRLQVPTEFQNRSNGPQDDRVERGESRSIQRQLYELKRSISTATRIENQVSDSTFAQEFANLHHELQNFIVNTFRRVKLTSTSEELCERLEEVTVVPKQRGYLQSLFVAFQPAMKLPAFQATAICVLMEAFEDPLLFGLPNQQNWRDDLRETMKTLPSILTPSAFNKWRYLTLDAVRQSVGIEQAVHSAASQLSDMICVTLSALTDMKDLGTRASSLNTIVMRAVQLSHLFRVQRAQYEFFLPAPGAPFQPDLMEDCAVDADSSSQRTVWYATFPSVIKHGDEDGNDMLLSNVVVKAKVICRG